METEPTTTWIIPIHIDQVRQQRPLSELEMAQEFNRHTTEGYTIRPFPEIISNIELLYSALSECKDEDADITVFYRVLRPDLTDQEKNHLEELNQQAYDAARAAGGLIVYFQGEELTSETINLALGKMTTEEKAQRKADLRLDFIPDCVSFCVWPKLKNAQDASRTQAHMDAVIGATKYYEQWAIIKFKGHTDEETTPEYPRVIIDFASIQKPRSHSAQLAA